MLDLAAGLTAAMTDPEFSREIRYFTGHLKIDVDGNATVAQFDDGHLVAVGEKDLPDSACEIVIRGTQEHFDKLLEEYPRPFYQCLQTTAVKHGLEISPTHQTFAYLPALNRLTTLLRTERVRTAS